MGRKLVRVLAGALFLGLVLACAGVATMNVQAWRGELVDDRAPSASTSPEASPAPASPAANAGATGSAPPGAAGDGAPAGPGTGGPISPASMPDATVSLTVRTPAGPCWAVARAGGPSGEVLYEGMLEQGGAVELESQRIWLRLGAAANVRLLVDGKREPALPGGTIDLVVSESGVRRVA